MIDIVTNNVRQIGTPADEGRVYISEKAYKMIKGESFRDREVYVLMGHTESSGGRYATFVESAIPVHTIEFERNTPQWTNKVWNEVFQKIKKEYEELIIVGWALCQKNCQCKVDKIPILSLYSLKRSVFARHNRYQIVKYPIGILTYITATDHFGCRKCTSYYKRCNHTLCQTYEIRKTTNYGKKFDIPGSQAAGKIK